MSYGVANEDAALDDLVTVSIIIVIFKFWQAMGLKVNDRVVVGSKLGTLRFCGTTEFSTGPNFDRILNRSKFSQNSQQVSLFNS